MKQHQKIVHEGRKDYACDKSSTACKYSFYNQLCVHHDLARRRLPTHTVARSCCAFSHRAPFVNCSLFATRGRASPPSAAPQQLCCFRPLLFQRVNNNSLSILSLAFASAFIIFGRNSIDPPKTNSEDCEAEVSETRENRSGTRSNSSIDQNTALANALRDVVKEWRKIDANFPINILDL
uniref:C2H2-type domain-containing protein n=1 Tax=Trichogramma kaykai TaxID=54128 RepID=A0ABD2W191_9HYME